jgi:hypothetical protein
MHLDALAQLRRGRFFRRHSESVRTPRGSATDAKDRWSMVEHHVRSAVVVCFHGGGVSRFPKCRLISSDRTTTATGAVSSFQKHDQHHRSRALRPALIPVDTDDVSWLIEWSPARHDLLALHQHAAAPVCFLGCSAGKRVQDKSKRLVRE